MKWYDRHIFSSWRRTIYTYLFTDKKYLKRSLNTKRIFYNNSLQEHIIQIGNFNNQQRHPVLNFSTSNILWIHKKNSKLHSVQHFINQHIESISPPIWHSPPTESEFICNGDFFRIASSFKFREKHSISSHITWTSTVDWNEKEFHTSLSICKIWSI